MYYKIFLNFPLWGITGPLLQIQKDIIIKNWKGYMIPGLEELTCIFSTLLCIIYSM